MFLSVNVKHEDSVRSHKKIPLRECVLTIIINKEKKENRSQRLNYLSLRQTYEILQKFHRVALLLLKESHQPTGGGAKKRLNIHNRKNKS